jgi:septum formation protein
MAADHTDGVRHCQSAIGAISPNNALGVLSPKKSIESNMKLILASTSPYRLALLQRLRIPFATVDPDVDEAPVEGELPSDRARRLGALKAAAVAAPDALVLGSDQVACVDGAILHKPRTERAAVQQLISCSGRTVRFWTAVSLRNTATLWRGDRVVTCDVRFRDITASEAERYIELDQPLDCAGSFKWESLGIALFRAIETDDPTALEGLPLIAVCDLLREAGLSLPLLSEKM